MDLYHFRLYYAVLSVLVALGSPASLVCDVFLCFITFHMVSQERCGI